MANTWSFGRGYNTRMTLFCDSCGNPALPGRSLCKSCVQRRIARSAVTVGLLVFAAALFIMYPPLFALVGFGHRGPVVVLDPVGDQFGTRVNAVGGWIYFTTKDGLVDDVTYHARLLGTPPSAQRQAPPVPPAPATASSPAAAPALSPAAAPASSPAAATVAAKTAPATPLTPPSGTPPSGTLPSATPAALPAAGPNAAAMPADQPSRPAAHAPTLELSASKTYGNRVLVTLPKLKLNCAPDPCKVRLWFDSAEPLALPYLDISSDDETILSFQGHKDITRRLAGSRSLQIEVQLPDGDSRFAFFPVEGFQAVMMAPKY